MGNPMATLEYARAYIEDLLVITKGSLDDHLDKLKQVSSNCAMPDLKSMWLSCSSVVWCTPRWIKK